jgi:DNA-binding NarL/FixJ family response regulator
MPIEQKIRVLIADDHEIVLCGLKTLLAGTDIQVVAEAKTGQAAIQLAQEREIDLVLLDVRMPDGDGLTVLGRLKLDKPRLPVLLFSAFDNAGTIARAIALGAAGYLLKGCSRDELLSTIRAAVAGETIWDREGLRRASRALRTRLAGTPEACLSERENEVLRHVSQGLTNKQIATAMNVSTETIKEHVHHIFSKIGLSDRTQAAVWAVRNHLV